jgi:predicted ATPase/class 3 adenylate cyclase/Flp pilus assembly protein TadD
VRQELPSGTVTLLFTDVEGSTRLLHELGAAAYAEVLEAHRRVIREACGRQRGVEVDTQGDAFFFAFGAAPAALAAAAELTEALSSGPVRVRVGVHTGSPLRAEEGYVGVDVHRAARIAAAGHGGQVLVSQSTAALVDGDLRDLGTHRFKDLLAPERVYQLGTEDFPRIRSLQRTNLPVAAWPLLGRQRELAELGALIKDGRRLVTLSGPGGSGKTRLALQAAAELSEDFLDGTFFVALAPLRDLSAVTSAVADAVGLRPDEDVAEWLSTRNVLLVLDNLEHLEGVAATVSELLVGDVVVLATSRAPLHLSAEQELPVEPLPDDAAAELLISRAAAAGRQLEADEAVAALCRRLDNLPLAIELAAARTRLLSPRALLERLDDSLALLSGGALDLPERQRTLRATIEWSHDLLDREAQAAFRRLSVFRGSFTLEAAEGIASAGLDELEALRDQSLLKTLGNDRFFLLETLREYARNRLDGAGETGGFALRHARWYLARLEEIDPAVRGPFTAEIFDWCSAEEDNLRAMLDLLTEMSTAEAARACELLNPYWIARGKAAEGRDRLQTVLAYKPPAAPRAALLACLAHDEEVLGHYDAALAAAVEAIRLAEILGDRRTLATALGIRGGVARRRGDFDEAVRFGRLALEHATVVGDFNRARLLSNLGLFLTGAGREEEARATLLEALDLFRRQGDPMGEAHVALRLANLDLYADDFENALVGFSTALDKSRKVGQPVVEAAAHGSRGQALLGLGRRREARAALREALDLAEASGSTPVVGYGLGLIALAADAADLRAAARILGAVAASQDEGGFKLDKGDEEFARRFEQPLIEALGEETWVQEKAAGATMTLEESIALARSLTERDVTDEAAAVGVSQQVE